MCILTVNLSSSIYLLSFFLLLCFHRIGTQMELLTSQNLCILLHHGWTLKILMNNYSLRDVVCFVPRSQFCIYSTLISSCPDDFLLYYIFDLLFLLSASSIAKIILISFLVMLFRILSNLYFFHIIGMFDSQILCVSFAHVS